MKLLVIAYNYPPIRGPEAIQAAHLITELEKQNIECDVVTRFAGHGRKFSNRVEAGGNVIRTFSLDFYLTKGLMRITGMEQNPDAEILWKPFAVKKASELLKDGRYDYIYTRSVPFSDHLAGLELKKKFGLPWIAHFSDPWAESIYANYKNEKIRRRNHAWERSVMKNADKLVFTSLETKELYAEKYGIAIRDKSYVLNHTYDETVVKSVKAEFGKESGSTTANESGKRIIISHVGNFYGKRTPDDIIEAVIAAKEQEGKLSEKLEIDLYGNVPVVYRDEIVKRGLSDIIKCKGEVSYIESQKAMCNSDYLLSVDAPCENNVFFPSKLVEYMAYERPIIGITPCQGTVSRILTEAGYLTVENGDVEALKGILLDAAEGRLNLAGIDYSAAEKYRPSTVAEDFIEILKK